MVRAWRNLTKYESRKEDMCEVRQNVAAQQVYACCQRLQLCLVADFEILNYQNSMNYEQRTKLEYRRKPAIKYS